MKIVCPGCGADYNVDDERIPPEGMKATCPKCLTSWVVGTSVGGITVGVPASPSAASPPVAKAPPSSQLSPVAGFDGSGGDRESLDSDEIPETIEFNLLGRTLEFPNIAIMRFLLNPKAMILLVVSLLVLVGFIVQWSRFGRDLKDKNISWSQVDLFGIRLGDFLKADLPVNDDVKVTGNFKDNLEVGLNAFRLDTFLGYQSAELSFRKAAKIKRRNAQVAMYLGQIYARLIPYSPLGKTDKDLLQKATVRIKRARRIEPKMAAAMGAWAEVDLAMRDFTGALKKIDQALLLNPNDALCQLTLGRIHLAKGSTELAKEAFTKAVNLDSTLASANYHLGLVLERNAEYEKAEAAWKKVLEISPSHTQALLALARMKLERFNLIKEADVILTEILEKHKAQAAPQEIAMVYYYQARSFERKSDIDGALASMAEARKIDSRSAKLVIYDAQLRARKDSTFNPDQFVDEMVMESMKSEDYFLFKGQNDTEKQNYQSAINWFQKVVELDPANAQAYYGLGINYQADMDPDKALSALEKSIRADRGYGDSYVRLATLQIDKGKLEEALKLLNDINSRNDRIAQVHNLMGQIALKKEDFATALAEFSRAIEIDPTFADAQRSMAQYYLKAQKFKEAEPYVMKAKSQDPEGRDTLMLLGQYYRETGKYDESMQIFGKILVKNPKDVLTLIEAGLSAMAKKDWKMAEEFLGRAQELNTENARIFYLRGSVLMKLEKYEEASTSIQNAQRFEPNNPDYWLRLGEIRLAQNRLSEAMQNLEEALKGLPNSMELHELLAQTHLASKQKKEAAREYEKVLELTTDKAKKGEIYLKLGDLWRQEGEMKSALKNYQDALKVNPKESSALYGIGLVFEESNEAGKALPYFQKAIQVDRKACLPHRNIGFIYKDRGSFAQAMTSFRQYLKLCPNAEDRDEISEEIDGIKRGGR